jgi:hypothetical protein
VVIFGRLSLTILLMRNHSISPIELVGKAINRYFYVIYMHNAQQVLLMVLIHRHSADDSNSKGKCTRRVVPDAKQSPGH